MSKELTINFSNPNKIFYPGQSIQGELIVDLKDEVKLREIRLEHIGQAKTSWTERRREGSGDNKRTRTIHYREKEDFVKETKSLLLPQSGEDNLILRSGQHRYPFNLKLPPMIPPSFEGRHGKIEYYINAVVDRPWAFDKTTKAKYTVAGLYNLNTEPLFAQPREAEDSKYVCCLCCRSGPLAGKFKVPKLGYVPGESIPFTAEIINHSSRNVRQAEVALVQIQTFRGKEDGFGVSMHSQSVKMVDMKVVRINHGQVPKGDSETWTGEKLVIPPLPISNFHPCSIIEVRYRLVLTVVPGGLAMALQIPIDIVVGSIPLEATAKMYGNTNPLTGNELVLGPTTTDIPQYMPTPAFASFTIQDDTEKSGPGNKIGSNEEEDDDLNWKPQYTYYNWNNYESIFK